MWQFAWLVDLPGIRYWLMSKNKIVLAAECSFLPISMSLIPNLVNVLPSSYPLPSYYLECTSTYITIKV